MYAVNDAFLNGQRIPNLFSARDEAWHGKILRPVRSLYATSSLPVLEPALDPVIDDCLKELEKRFSGPNAGKSFDASTWMDFCTV